MPGIKYPGIEDFLKRYAAKAAEAKVDPLGFYLPPFNYAIGQMLEQAVGATKSLDHKRLADYLRKNEMKTIVGPIKYGPDGEWANAARGAGAVPRRDRQGHGAVPPARQAGGAVPAAVQDRRRRSRRSRRRAASRRLTENTARRSRAVFLGSMTSRSTCCSRRVLFGILLGCFYAAVSMGLSVSFGLLDVPHVAHPAIMVLGSYCTYLLARCGIDPIVAGVLLMPPFFVLGMARLPLLLRGLREARHRGRACAASRSSSASR